MRIAVKAEWDMGHRLPNHGGECRNLHGHRYVAELIVAGLVDATSGAATEGMVADFADVKAIVRAEVAKLDHRFLVCDADPLLASLRDMPGVVAVPFVPTAENIAVALISACRCARGVGAWWSFESVRVYETPTAWVEAS